MTHTECQNTARISCVAEIRKELGFGVANRTDPAAGRKKAGKH